MKLQEECPQFVLEIFFVSKINNFTKFSEFNESLQNLKMVCLPEALFILQTKTLPVVVEQSAFPLLPRGRYLLPVTTQNRY